MAEFLQTIGGLAVGVFWLIVALILLGMSGSVALAVFLVRQYRAIVRAERSAKDRWGR